MLTWDEEQAVIARAENIAGARLVTYSSLLAAIQHGADTIALLSAVTNVKPGTLRRMLKALEQADGIERHDGGAALYWTVKLPRGVCGCMTEDPGDGEGERVLTHSATCFLHPDYPNA